MSAEAREPQTEPPHGRVLAGRKVVVSGASSGIGRAIALAFADAGADVIVGYRRSHSAAAGVVAAARERGVRAEAVQADLSIDDELHRFVRESYDLFGRIDVWVNNAGHDILTGEGAQLSLQEKLDRLIAVDLRATVLCSWQVAERMRAHGGGVILNMSWDRALTGLAGREGEMFSAVKGGVQGFSRSLALTVAPWVRVNVLAPGWIATAFAESLDEDARRRIAESTLLGRWGEPEDVARAAVFLASPAAAYMTGVVLPINGGGSI